MEKKAEIKLFSLRKRPTMLACITLYPFMSKSAALHNVYVYIFTFSHLADAFIQSDLQRRTMEAIKINKRATHASVMTSLS